MSDISTAFRHRVPVHFYARFQGLPSYVFGDGPDPEIGGVVYSPSLRVSDQSINAETKSGKPIGSGRAVELLLDADTLSASGVYSALFNPPSQMTAITGTIQITDTTINVNSTSAFASSGNIYWGHEKIAYSGKTSTSFTGCTRGAGATSVFINYATAAPSGVSGIWSMVTEKPVLWRGRLVEIWAVAANTEGELLGAPFTVSDACWRIWIGHVDGQAVFVTTGISIRCLPAERAIDHQYGWGQVWKVSKSPEASIVNDFASRKWAQQVIYWPLGATVTISATIVTEGESTALDSFEDTDDITVDPFAGVAASSVSRVLTVFEMWNKISAAITTEGTLIMGVNIDQIGNGSGLPEYFHNIVITMVDGALDGATPGNCDQNWTVPCGGKWVKKISIRGGGHPDALFKMHHVMGDYSKQCIPSNFKTYNSGGSEYKKTTFIVKPPYAKADFPSWRQIGGFWIVQPEEGSGQIYAGAPLEGYHVAWETAGEMFTAKVEEVIPVSSTWAGSEYFVVIGQHIGSDLVPYEETPSELKECVFIDGQQTIGDVWEFILQTSGGALIATSTPGSFGSSDMLPIGWGARIPSAWIAAGMADGQASPAVNPFIAFDLDADSLFIDAISAKVALTQKYVSGQAVIDTAELIAPQEAETTTTIATSRMLEDPIRLGERDKPPNVVEIGWYTEAKPKLIIRNALRVHSEGSVKKRAFKLPDSWAGPRLNALASSVMTPNQLLSDVYVYEIPVGPEEAWSTNPGDQVQFTGSHYAFADPVNGKHRGTSLTGRVVGVTRKLDGTGGAIKMNVWPLAVGNYYSPDSPISAIDAGANTITLPAGRVDYFWNGEAEDIIFYRPGSENSHLVNKEMQSSSSNNIVLDSLPAWLTTDDRVTFAASSTASDRQKGWAHVDDGGQIP